MRSSSPRPIARIQMLVVALLLGTTAAPAAQPLSGRAIMDEAHRRHSADLELETQRMVLIEGNGSETQRTLRRYARKGADGRHRYLLVFDEPAGVRGVALLTWEKPGEDDQWTFLPAMGTQLKRIAGGGRRNAFMGTDFAFEDLVSEERDNFRYERLADAALDGSPVFVVDAVPANPELSTGYDRRRLYLRQDNFLLVEAEYFARGTGVHSKTFRVEQAKQLRGEMWRATRAAMETLKDRHKTRVEMVTRSDNPADVPDEVFAHAFIQSKRHMR